MKSCGAVTLCFFLFLASVSLSKAQENDFLDLTKIKLPERKELVLTDGGGASGSNDTRIPNLPLEITLTGLDKNSYQIGEDMIYDIRISNVGQELVWIPWSPDRHQVRPDNAYPSGYMSAILTLVITDAKMGQQEIFGIPLYGSRRVPGSLKALPPRKTVRIRASGRWDFMSSDNAFLSDLPQTYGVRAKLNLIYLPPSPSPEPVLSTNSTSVQLQSRQ